MLLEYDVIIGCLSNVSLIIGSLNLIFERDEIILIGLGCLFSWMTVFKIFKRQKRLVLMFDLIRASFTKVLQFFTVIIIVLMAYVFLGMCLFPKTRYFSTMSKAITTIISLTAGDSASTILTSISQRYSIYLATIYIFSVVILFMHAIHNILTSIIK